MADDVLGRELGARYVVEAELGRGRVAVVYAAHDRQDGAAVAIKRWVPPPVDAEPARARLARAVELGQRLDHPGIVRVHRLHYDGDCVLLVMDRAPGQTLTARVAERGPLTAAEVQTLGLELAAALDHAHGQLLLHGELHPDHVVIDDDGRALLLGFGGGASGHARLGEGLDYAAPEVIGGEAADARADVYGLGLVLYFATTGQLPKRPSAQLPPAPADRGHRPSAAASGVPPWLDVIVRRATMADPRQRFATMALMSRALEGHHWGGHIAATSGAYCLACAEPISGARRLCRACEAAPVARGDRLVSVDVAASGGNTRVRQRLEDLLGATIDRPSLDDVARGQRPLVRVRERDVTRVVERLERDGLRVRVPSARRTWLPTLRSAAAAAAAGGAGQVALSAGLWPLAVLGFGAAAVGLAYVVVLGRRPVLERRPLDAPAVIPSALWLRCARVLERLGDHAMRGVLVDLAELAAEASSPEGAHDAREVVPRVVQLFEAAVTAAEALVRVERVLAYTAPPHDTSQQRTADEARTALVQRLLAGLSTMSTLVVGSPSSGAARALEEATSDLAREVELREQALAEVEALTRA
jgi:hypothetical protein